MTPAEHQAAALGQLAGWAFDGAVHGVQRVHRQIIRRAFGATGLDSSPARRCHDTIAALAYTGVRGVGAAVLAGAGALAGVLTAHRTALAETPAGREALASLNGLIGDRLAAGGSPLDTGMALHRDDRQVTGRVVLFVHGLVETERWWFPRDGTPGFGDRLHDELGWNPVYLRYNTGRHISDSATALDDLLDELVRDWPVPVTGLALVGHSMGGLVARSAARRGADRDAAWVRALRDVVCLGSPHRGTDLEKAANITGWVLRGVPETQPLAEFLELRSSGIKDLRFGYLGESDWAGHQADALLDDRRGDCADLPGVHYHFVAARLSGPVGGLLGDVLVREASAFDHRTSGSLTRLGGLHHLGLLTHPEVYRLLRRWLERPPVVPVRRPDRRVRGSQGER